MIEETDDKVKIDIEIECESCNGSGLYSGMAEKNGCAVVCRTCDGIGKSRFKHTFAKFTGRRKKKGIRRVFQTSGGYVVGPDDVTTKEGVHIPFSQYGCEYKDWLEGATPRPLEALHCPYQHTHQDMQLSSHPAHKLYKEKCDGANLLGNYIADCKGRKEMHRCWARYHELVD